MQYEGCTNRWTFHPAALVKVMTYQVGDIVTIITDATKVQQLQKGHGEWVETMRNILGKTGKVLKVYADGDLRVHEMEDNSDWTLNPKCVKLERSQSSAASAAERSNSMMDLSHQRADHVLTPLSGLSGSGSSAADKLVREAAQGRLEYVKPYLDAHPDQVDCMSAGKTCLQVAAHQGHIQIVKYLLSLHANVNIVDKEGDSTLHYAAFGNQPEIMKILLLNGAHINVLNSSHCSALHISAHKKPPHCVRILLEFGADVNIQDSYGDTALHDAIGKENAEVVELLCNAPNLDLTVRNNRGFNALHHASLKGNVAATHRILQLAPQLVDIKKDDGFAPLHLASLNGHAAVAEILVREGKADINIRNNRRQTPFLLAVSQGHAAAIEKLVNLGCDVLAKDEDGDNAMHLCVIKKTNLTQEVNVTEAPKIYEIYQSLAHCQENRLMYAILCYLAQSGCQIDTNNKGNKILHWIPNKEMQDLICSYIKTRPSRSNGTDATDQLYTNVQSMSLTESGNSGNTSTSNTDVEFDDQTVASSSSSANPPTPMRRNREQANASPSIGSDDASVNNQNVPKKMNNVEQQANKYARQNAAGASSDATASSSTSSQGSNDMNGLSASVIDNDFAASSMPSHKANVTAAPPSLPSSSKDNSNNSHVSRKENNGQAIVSGSGGGVVNIPATSVNNKIINQMGNGQISECIVCNEIVPLVLFEPCTHQIACNECSMRMKKCLSCQTVIERRRITGNDLINTKLGNIISSGLYNDIVGATARQPSVERLAYLENKIQEMEETHCCSICLERRRNVAFLCGHLACSKCAETLKTCHMCRKTISKKINLY